jgi:uncharacterized membrane protein YfcA
MFGGLDVKLLQIAFVLVAGIIISAKIGIWWAMRRGRE